MYINGLELPNMPILGPRDFFIMEQMFMLNGIYWWSGQALTNWTILFHTVQNVLTNIWHML